MERNRFSEFLIEKGLFITAIFSIIIILLIVSFILIEGLPAFEDYGFFRFLFGMTWAPNDGDFGVFAMIIGSIYVTMLSLLMAVPLSLLCAIFMAEVAPNNVRRILKPVIETLSGIPSVVYGFFGLIVLVPLIRTYFGGTGFSMFTAAIILTVMVLPTIITISQDSLRAVPQEYREASFGLGATNWQTIRHIIFPAALPGIITAIILGMGRAIGETLAVIMIAGNVVQIPGSIFDPVRTLTANIALEMGYATGLHYNALFGTAIVLFLIIMILLLIANYIQHKYKVDVGGGYL
ncbi:MAG: phosphate ABC transporter permease subunit PstC [Methanobrevibacter arboriphilus]|jgi:phosphate transport system permease protein|uniref:Phosphate ABC transporter permease subunit PstC n=2 Tax=Methanobrevibacter arboriphilus TaxID=39441 RepID=A0ACA8R2X7_METAZ|nr:phosphate ABC transporter permease subunit PstC [Methanobrevibacter arboriphilus]MBF4469331.1 phosphate ABC transporter permease subunit PstC [Methanobrevibacter arboriphilus]BBL61824.1 phosphate ABC transporter permease subunit PstC [Methanobrevibacter arboriphilus]GLI10936.1 phosphate ABC transporter permease subunit PstC [Methanobrevibacter arboriphilus]